MGPLEAHPRHDQVLQAGAVGDHEYPHKEKGERSKDEEHCSDVGEIEVHGRLPFWLPDVSGYSLLTRNILVLPALLVNC